MKRNLGFLALLCLFFGRADAQDLKIGDRVPDVLVRGVSGLRLGGKDVGGEVRLSAFKGKLLLLDFWATWCAPCRAMVPVMDSLQRVFGERLVVLPVSDESAAVVGPVLAQLQRVRPFSLPGVTGDKVLQGLFPHRSLPHYVWIDAEGVVRAVTEEKEVTGGNISRVLSGRGLAGVPVKRDLEVAYNAALPLLVNGNGGDGSSLVYHSVLTGYVPGLSGALRISAFDPKVGQFFTVRNGTFLTLCRLAFGDGGRYITDARFKLLSRDSSRLTSRLSGQAYLDWQAAGNGWCYELLVPPGLSGRGFALMQEDIRRLFPQYAVSLEQQRTKCLVLVRTSAEDRLKAGSDDHFVKVTPFSAVLKGMPLSALMLRLQMQYLQNSPLPVIDGTAYTNLVDMELEGRMYEVASLNAALARYDLAFVEREAVVEMLVVRDAPAVVVTPVHSGTDFIVNPKP
jgi:thiol-disulfide isomerase/thioredoxin